VHDQNVELFGGAIDRHPEPVVLAPSTTRLRIDFAPRSLARNLRYQTRLEPLDAAWGPWSTEARVEYPRLPDGTYTLRVRTMTTAGHVSPEAAWSFVVEAPWFRRPWALALWAAVVLALARAYAELRSRTATLRSRQLERRVAEQTGELRSTVVELRGTQERLEAANQQLLALSTLDELTGLANRRLLDERLADEWSRARRQGRGLGLILVDLDRFKELNDSLGHLAGDECLRAVGGTLGRLVRRDLDLVARYGGEEFAVLLPEIDLAGARSIAEGLRRGIEEATYLGPSGVPVRITASFGFAVARPATEASNDVSAEVSTDVSADVGGGSEPRDERALIEAADRALYRAKRAGRNRVVGPDPAEAVSAPV
jgi:diguanylate cyclase (GGDEF)-like protein